jgi:uncharacterized protein YwqG
LKRYSDLVLSYDALYQKIYMNLFHKIISLFKGNKKSTTGSEIDNYKYELKNESLNSIADLEKLVTPLIRNATKIEVLSPISPEENSHLLSQFGGEPYFETGEKWPTSKTEKPLEFIFQIFNNGTNNLPEEIQLIQFFYDWDEFPWDTGDDGWLVKIYNVVNKNNVTRIDTPSGAEERKYCKVNFKSIQSLPDWEGIETYSKKASKLSCILNEDEPWKNYDKVVVKLIGEQNYQSQLGGYPKWVQGESTPKASNDQPMKLLFQIDSEDNAELMWGDVGLIYVFYNEGNKQIEFSLQCH